MKLDGGNIATIIVAVVGLLGMWLSQKISARASTQNQRVLAEVEAYSRAVKMDRDTIERQKKELEEYAEEQELLKKENKQLKADGAKKDITNAALVRQVLALQERIRKKEANG